MALAVSAPGLENLLIWLDAGETDPWLARTTQLHDELAARGIQHEWHPYPGGHEGNYWVEHALDYLMFYGHSLARQVTAPGAPSRQNHSPSSATASITAFSTQRSNGQSGDATQRRRASRGGRSSLRRRTGRDGGCQRRRHLAAKAAGDQNVAGPQDGCRASECVRRHRRRGAARRE